MAFPAGSNSTKDPSTSTRTTLSSHVSGIDVQGVSEGAVQDWLPSTDGGLTLARISDVLHVPGLRLRTGRDSFRLFSASATTKQGHAITFRPKASILQLSKTTISIPLRETNDLYYMDAI
eukprot:scaffold395325_cov24-Prasinocladus_malaysianus.AAC.1